jgi:hypothetical protein
MFAFQKTDSSTIAEMSWVVHTIDNDSAEIKKDRLTVAGLNLPTGPYSTGTGDERD